MPHPRPAAWHSEQEALERSWLDRFARAQAAPDADPLSHWDTSAQPIDCPPPIPA